MFRIGTLTTALTRPRSPQPTVLAAPHYIRTTDSVDRSLPNPDTKSGDRARAWWRLFPRLAGVGQAIGGVAKRVHWPRFVDLRKPKDAEKYHVAGAEHYPKEINLRMGETIPSGPHPIYETYQIKRAHNTARQAFEMPPLYENKVTAIVAEASDHLERCCAHDLEDAKLNCRDNLRGMVVHGQVSMRLQLGIFLQTNQLWDKVFADALKQAYRALEIPARAHGRLMAVEIEAVWKRTLSDVIMARKADFQKVYFFGQHAEEILIRHANKPLPQEEIDYPDFDLAPWC